MIKNILTHIGGIENYGIISMCLFVFVFIGMLIRVFTLKKSHLDDMARTPLEPNSEANRNSDHTHE